MLVTVIKFSSWMVVFAGVWTNRGGVLAGAAGALVTITLNWLLVLDAPSLTEVTKIFVDGACAEEGVQVITPVAAMVAPDGATVSW